MIFVCFSYEALLRVVTWLANYRHYDILMNDIMTIYLNADIITTNLFEIDNKRVGCLYNVA